MFFYKASYLNGPVRLKKDELVDYAWVTKEEMAEYFEKDFYESIKDALLD